MNRTMIRYAVSAFAAVALVAAFAAHPISAQAAKLKTSPAAGPICNPACPAGQICKWAASGNGATICSSDIISFPDCGNDPLCGLDKRRKRKGPSALQW
jgi:hypothetical protein